MPIVTLPSLKALVGMAENMILNSVGTRLHPCFTPFETGKCSDVSSFPGLKGLHALTDLPL